MNHSLKRWFFLSGLLLLPLCASAATHEGNGWSIRKWTKETTAECGDVVWYILEVTRTGPGPVDAFIVDGMDSGAQAQYLSAYPPSNDGGGAGDRYMLWERTMNQGDTFTAIYAVQLKTPLSIGTVLRNWALVHPDPYDPDQHLSVDHELMIGAGNKTKGANPCTGEGGDPVNTATGEFFLAPMTDFDLGGPLPLRFTRWYASRMNDPGLDSVESALGIGWMHNYEAQTFRLAGYLSRFVLTEEGKLVPFVPLFGDEGGWALNFEQEPVSYELKEDGKSFWFLDPERERLYRFNADGWSYVQEMVDRNGNSLQINRRPDLLVTNVTDGLGRSLDFEYTLAGNLLRVTDGTRSVGFAYDAQGTAIAVTNVLGDVMTYQYDPVHSPTTTCRAP